MKWSGKEMAPRVLEHPGTRPTATSRVKEATVDDRRIALIGDPFTSRTPRCVATDDTIEAHYASLERGVPCSCIAPLGVVYIGHLVEGEDGEEVEVFDAMPCRRCSESR